LFFTTKVKFVKVSVLLTVSILFSTGCGLFDNNTQQPELQQQSAQGEQQPEKVPDQLKSIENSIETIIKNLDGPAVVVEEDKKKEPGGEGTQGKPEEDDQNQQSKESEGNGEGEQKQQEQGGENNKEQQGNEAQQKEPPKQPVPQTPWDKITPVIHSLHYQWNGYVPSAVKSGANGTLVDNFDNSLNTLTSSTIGKNRIETLMAASSLYSYIPEFYSLYRTPNSPEIKRIRYYTRNAILNAMNENWEQADSDIESLKTSWSIFKNTLRDEQRQESSKLDFSIIELEKVIAERSQPLSDIKGKVAMSNIESLEKSSEKQSQQSGEDGGS
jgi:hypothetical protein